MKLVSDWKRAWRWFSVQAMAVAAAIPLVWMSLPPELKGSISDDWLPWIASAVAVAGILGRVVEQDKPE